MVQNLMVLRFGNTMFDSIWSNKNIQCINIEFKEDFGVEGRGGFFDDQGIVRDMLQSHLLQVMTLLTMEAPDAVITNSDTPEALRDARFHLLKNVKPIQLEDVLLGQYEGYTDDDSIDNKDSKTSTFAAIKLDIDSDRWRGVPIILKAGKALNESHGEMRIQFRDPPNAHIFGKADCPRNEMVITMQPSPRTVRMATNVKKPGNETVPIRTELNINFCCDLPEGNDDDDSPDPYSRLLLDVFGGDQSAFIRADELRRAWEIFTPVLDDIDNGLITPIVYKRGSRGPEEADAFIQEKGGYRRNEGPLYDEGQIKEKK